MPRKQRRRITTVREDALIVRKSKKNPHKSANEIRISVFSENRAKLSVDTVKHRLREAGLFRKISRNKPLLFERNRKKRIKFAKKYRHWTAVDWKKEYYFRTKQKLIEYLSMEKNMFVGQSSKNLIQDTPGPL